MWLVVREGAPPCPAVVLAKADVRAVVDRGKGYGRAASPLAAVVPRAGGPSVCSAKVPVAKVMVGRPDPWPPSLSLRQEP